jgi:hypothetical protein
MKDQSVDYLAMWGAALSTLLALVKFWELWTNRSRIDISYNFTGSEDIGNEVIIRNLGGTPLLITYWELLWRHRRWFRWKQSRELSPDECFEDLNLGGHTSITLSFRDHNYFDWGATALGNDRIYLRLHIAGKRKPLLRLLYAR